MNKPPPLPEPSAWQHEDGASSFISNRTKTESKPSGKWPSYYSRPLFTAEQMRAYAAAAVAADRDAICRLVFGHCGSDNDAQRIVDAIRAMK